MEQIVFKFQLDFTNSMQNITMLDEEIEKMASIAGDSGYKSKMSEEFKNHMAEVTAKTAALAYPIFKELWTSRIQNGEVTPELAISTLKAKQAKGLSSAPLLGETGDFSNNFGLGEVTNDTIEFIHDSNTPPSWFGASWYVEPTLADGMPIRRVIDEQEANQIIYEQFYMAYESVNFGEKIQKPDKMTFSVSSNVSVSSSDSAGNDKLKKKKNAKLKGVKVKSKIKRSTQAAKTKAVKNSKLRGRR